LVVLLKARTRHQNPLVGEVDRVLGEQRVAAQQIGLVAVAGAHGGTGDFIAVHRVFVVEGGLAVLADQLGTVDLAVFVVHAKHQVMLHASSLNLALQAEGAEAIGGDRAFGAVHFARQGAVGVDLGDANLAGVVGFAVPAVAEMGFPVVVEVVIDFKAVQVRAPFHIVEGFVQAAGGRNVQRMVGRRVDGRATVERGQEFAMFVRQQHLGVVAIPGQRRRDQGFAMHTKITPVIFVFMVDDHPVGQPRITQRPGAVEAATAAVFAGAVG